MILRIAISVQANEIQSYLTKTLSSSDVAIDQVRPTRGAWERIVRRGCDIVVISQALIPTPLEQSFNLLNELPEIPTTVVITDSSSAEEHAGLLAAGCDTVLYSELPQHQLFDAIEATIANRRQLLSRHPADLD